MRSGIDSAGLDHGIRPQDDLFAHVNASWSASTSIPDDRGRYGAFDQLRESAEHHVRDIITGVAASDPAPGTVARKVGDLHTSFTDEERVESVGMTPLQPLLALIGAVRTPGDILEVLGDLARYGVDGLVHPIVSTDDRDSSRYIVYLEQAGLGLPDEAYYREPQHESVRAAYPGHIERMFAATKVYAAADAAAAAERVVALETALAAAHWDHVTNRDAIKTYTLLTHEELDELTGGVEWDRYLAAAGVPFDAFAQVIARQPDYLSAMGDLVRERDIESWRDWLRWRLVHALAPYLPRAVVEENFDFYGRTLSGVPQLRERWKRAVAFVEDGVGEAVGQLYVEQHFPPRAKERMSELVANLIEAFRRDFATLDWMGEATRAQALAKLDTFTPKIGYPDRWHDYDRLKVDPTNLMANVAAIAGFEIDRNFGKLGGPVDRGEWFMTPQTVNAYYNPGMNEIVFPAAILQPPFFDVEADDAVNYGGIGAVIGHEIGHGFDDQGSQYDQDGNLRNWWTDEDRSRFEERSRALIAQFNELETRDAPGHKVNGALTVGENIGDLGGLAIGHAAYRISTEGSGAPEIDGFTGDQRFFIGWAQVWRGVAREEEAVRLLATDPHSPIDVRANAVRNIDEFHEAFDTKPGDGLWLAHDERIRIF